MAAADRFSLSDHSAEEHASPSFIGKKIEEQVRRLRLFFILGLLLLVGCFSLANFLIVRQVVAPGNQEIERKIAQKDMDRVTQALKREIEFLSTFTLDWAAWDDTCDFVSSYNTEYIASNLVDTTFTGNRLNLIAFYDPRGRVVWQRIVDLETMQDLQLPEFPERGLPPDSPLLAHADPLGEVAGIMVLAGGAHAMLVAARPIVTSSRQGPLQGTLVFGRFLTSKTKEQLSEQTKIDLHIHPLAELKPPDYDEGLAAELAVDGSSIFKEEDGKILVYSLFEDYQGLPNIVLEAAVDRFVSSQTGQLFKYVLISNLLTGLAALVFILLFYNKLVHSLLKIFQLSSVMARTGVHSEQEVSPPDGQWDQLGLDVYQAAAGKSGKRLLPHASLASEKSSNLWEVSLWLAREVEQRGRAEASLRRITRRLERLVQERTAELQDVNDQLQVEIGERRQYEVKLEKYQKRLRAVASEMLAVEERQRRQIAVDLHDRIGQSLSVSRMSLDSVLELENIEDVRQQVAAVTEILQQTLRDTRTLTFELCPPVLHELGIGAGLEWLSEMMEERYKLVVRVEYEPLEAYTDSPILTLAFRSVRELLMNVVRHARTDSARIKVWQKDEQLHLQVSDQGAGFDTEALELEDEKLGGFGLFSVQERVKNIGGSITIDSAVGDGTTITLVIPLGVPG